MKRLVVTFCFLVCALTASAQYMALDYSQLESRGSRIFADGDRLSCRQAVELFSRAGGGDMGDDYLRYRSAYKAGVGLSVGGAALTVVGGMTFSVSAVAALIAGIPLAFSGGEMPKGIETGIYAGLGATALGAAAMLAGIPVAAVYRHRIKKMTIGLPSSGFGLAMTF